MTSLCARCSSSCLSVRLLTQKEQYHQTGCFVRFSTSPFLHPQKTMSPRPDYASLHPAVGEARRDTMLVCIVEIRGKDKGFVLILSRIRDNPVGIMRPPLYHSQVADKVTPISERTK